MIKAILVITCFTAGAFGQWNENFARKRAGIVHLFEWKFKDIAKECEEFLGPNNFGGVQTSPVNENAIVANRPWYERYQPMSFKINTRSGNEIDFQDMTRRCNAVGVRIYVDVVVNHMAPPGPDNQLNGTAGSVATPSNRSYPGVSFNTTHFHAPCAINNYNNATNVRDCELVSLPDLNQTLPYVREKIVEFMNHLIDLGAAGFRMDACKHMLPNDLDFIYKSVKSLQRKHGFITGARPFIYQEVIDEGDGAVKRQEYTPLGTVTDFTYSTQMGMNFQGKEGRDLSNFANWGIRAGFLPSKHSFVFVDNHDNQRQGDANILTYKFGNTYQKAVILMLAHPHGIPRVMSSFAFSDGNQGPPAVNETITSPTFGANGQCKNGWVCEHRWPAIRNMINFRISTEGTKVFGFTNIAKNQIAFCRGSRGFVAINNSDKDLNTSLNLCVPPGKYCDVVSGSLVGGKCTGKTIEVKFGKNHIEVPADSTGAIAIHVGARLSR